MDVVGSILLGQKYSDLFNGIRSKEYLEKIDELDSVVLIGRKWFDRRWGNTYHTVTVYINNKFIKKSRITYGYSDQYIQTAHEILKEQGYFNMDLRLPSGADCSYQDFVMWGRDSGKLIAEGIYVSRKADL